MSRNPPGSSRRTLSGPPLLVVEGEDDEADRDVPLPRHQLRGRPPRLRPAEIPRELEGSRGVVLLQVGPVDRVLQALAPRARRAYRNLSPGDLDDSAGLLQEGPVPASWFQAPGSNEHAAFHHHGPDADEAVRLGARPDAQDLPVADGR